MGFLAFPVLFFVVWAIFDALLGSPWGLVLAIVFGFVIPALLLTIGILEDRDRARELAELSGRRPSATTHGPPPGPRMPSTSASGAPQCPAGPRCPHAPGTHA